MEGTGTVRTRGIAGAVGLLVAAACIAAFHWAGRGDGHTLRYVGTTFIDARELRYVLYLTGLGGVGWVAAAFGLQRLASVPLAAIGAALGRRPRMLVGCIALSVVAAALTLHYRLLLGQPVADDELTYRFVAQTLMHGRVTNPLPLPPEFLSNQFVVLNERGWFGKYPVGHPALLALGMLVHAEALVVPLLGAAGVLLTFEVGRRIVGERRAALACLLLLVSPQYVLTHATTLSQPTSMVCMLLGMLGLLRVQEDGPIGWALLGGTALGLGCLARPLPGLLFVGVAVIAFVVGWAREHGSAGRWPRRATQLLLAGLGVAGGLGLLLWVNHLQAGAPLRSGYHEYHSGGLGVAGIRAGARISSLLDALIRQSSWLLGWPLALLFALLARPRRGAALLWGMIVAEYAYRMLVPKTVVATTGPIYVMEVVPLWALAVADGMARSAAWMEARRPGTGRGLVGACLGAGLLVCASCFLPAQLRAIAGGAAERAQVFTRLEATGAERPLVFAFDSLIVFPNRRRTWAYYAPPPMPNLDDRILFLRVAPDDPGFVRAHALWRKNFADRRAFVLLPSPQGPVLRELPERSTAAVPARRMRPNPH